MGSVFGGVARYSMASAITRIHGAGFPYGTLMVNLVGCLLIGLMDGLADGRARLSPQAKMLLMIGFCGAFTTFSTFILETSSLMRSGETAKAFGNLFISVTGGALFLWLGGLLAKTVPSPVTAF